ncbi:DUF3017 domain-containing protein [Nocardioides massiliensis]|uniref:DUF3017 domain-containing protein n=1 Tax=Nocardioides massiliensis TaxID=1325935 RepID=A0ABT9NP53_9ACTN|nr:DUF3017 domain-containing protein [Nocardioides massiliensis]MDP9822189.1 hypothetical protein [Nocardioides massiliensis]
MIVPPAGSPAPAPESRHPQTIGGVIYLCLLGAVAVGIALVAVGSWRSGVSCIGATLVVAAGGRLVLNDHAAGMLRVRRHRWFDVVVPLASGVAMIVLAATIPDQI